MVVLGITYLLQDNLGEAVLTNTTYVPNREPEFTTNITMAIDADQSTAPFTESPLISENITVGVPVAKTATRVLATYTDWFFFRHLRPLSAPRRPCSGQCDICT